MRMNRMCKLLSACTAAALLTGCSQNLTYKDVTEPEHAPSKLMPISDTYRETPAVYENEGIPDRCLDTVSSENGCCVIRKMEHYYDVTLDYEKFSPAEVGAAYAEAVLTAFPDFHEVMEPYIYENIVVGFPALEDDYEPVTERISYLAETLRPAHKEELYAFAETISGGIHGYEQDKTISYEEALTFNLIPEALRGTACSALSLWGSKTESGDNVSIRFLDWALGSENQMCMGHAVIHANKGERSYTAISFLGFVSVVSAVNNDGVFGAILDVGSGNEPYSYKDKKCYTYDLKYALEEYDTAEKVGNFMVQNSADYTWSHHIYVTDKDHAYCAEDATGALQKSGKGYSILRDCNTPLIDGLKWDSKDSLCVVNSFASQGNQDFFCGGTDNIVRFKKYNEWVSSKDHFSIGEMKSMLTREKVNQGQYENEAYVVNFRNRGTVQIILVDYHTGRVQVSFTGTDGPSDDVIFTDIGHY